MQNLKTRKKNDEASLPLNDVAELPLRDRKKARQRADLLRIALKLFKEKGYDSSRMEDIAVMAGVSTPTVYNYFLGKSDVLVEVLKLDREETKPAFENIVDNPAPEPEDAFADLIYANMACVRGPRDKMLWREILAAVARSHDKERDSFEENHEVFKHYIERLLLHFTKNGKLSRNVPVETAVDVIFAINSHNLRNIVSSERSTPETIRSTARQQIKLLLSGWRESPQRLNRVATKKKR